MRYLKPALSVVLSLPLTVTAAHGQSAAGNAARVPTAEDAPIAILMDATNGQILFAREADRRFMPASLTKTMTTFLAFEMMEAGTLDQNKVVSVRPETFRKWRGVGSTMFLGANAQVRVDDLLHGVTTVSANDGAVVLAEGAAGSLPRWIAAMNAKAHEIGMSDSRFGTPNGWMDEGRTFVTARDLATLGRAMVRRHPAKYAHYVGKREFRYRDITQPNHDPLSGVVEGADGIKTGFTNQAGYGYLGSARRGDRRLVLVIAGAPRVGARNRAARQLLEWGFANFEQRQLAQRGRVLGTARVQQGTSANVPLAPLDPVVIDLPYLNAPQVTARVRYEGPLIAPITKGEKIAELEVTAGQQGTYTVPLAAAEDIGRANLFQRILNGIRGWFA